jgi:DNA-binding IscR family transcriptional regulator
MNCLEDHVCFADAHCSLQELWGDVHLAVRRVFEATTLGDLADRHRKLRVWSPSELIRPRP